MKRLIVAYLIAGALTSPAHAALKEGDAAPDFTAQASLAGKSFTYSLKEGLSKGPVVVYFYPSAFTTGCTLEAHTFATQIDKFNAAGATIVGISLDNISRLQDFSASPDSCAGKFPVASDIDGKISRSFEINVRNVPGHKDTRGTDIDHGFAERTSFVVSSDGHIVATLGGLSPTANVEKALEAVQKLAESKH